MSRTRYRGEKRFRRQACFYRAFLPGTRPDYDCGLVVQTFYGLNEAVLVIGQLADLEGTETVDTL